MDITDEQLARQAQAGDRAALGTLLERKQQAVFAMTYRILHNRSDALDAAQEACLRVCRHLGSYRPERRFAPWLRTVAVRAALDQARRAGRLHPSEQPVEQLPGTGPDPAALAEDTQARARIRDALARLSPAQRAAFVCKEIEGMDTRAIARTLGCRRTTVRWHLHQARKRLADALIPYAGGAT